MSAFSFYLSIPLNDGSYSDFEDITGDILASNVGSLSQNLSSNEYDIGTIKFNKISLNLRNEKARYSEANNPLSIFTFKRDESILKIMWDRNTNPIICGSFQCGLTFLSEPIEVYRGLLEDNSSKFDANAQLQSFNFLGLESIIGKVQVDFSALSVLDNVETTIYNILNQSKITNILSVSLSNISVNMSFIPDSIASLEDRKCLDALDELLFLSGAILYVENSEIIVRSRVENPVSVATFYGPSSDLGIENIIDLGKHTQGLNRTFNFWKWKGTTVKQSFADSIDSNGFRDKEIDSDLITSQITQIAILNAMLTEFAFPKIELEFEVPMTSPIVNDIFLLDKINIDYPSDYRSNESSDLPATYGKAIYGTDSYINAVSSLIIDVSTDWKILNRSISISQHKITFKIREI